jgi:hypothetical protein
MTTHLEHAILRGFLYRLPGESGDFDLAYFADYCARSRRPVVWYTEDGRGCRFKVACPAGRRLSATEITRLYSLFRAHQLVGTNCHPQVLFEMAGAGDIDPDVAEDLGVAVVAFLDGGWNSNRAAAESGSILCAAAA